MLHEPGLRSLGRQKSSKHADRLLNNPEVLDADCRPVHGFMVSELQFRDILLDTKGRGCFHSDAATPTKLHWAHCLHRA